MLYVTNYRLRPHMAKGEVKKLMDIFGTRPRPQGELAHYVRVDGGGGTTVIETDDIAASYADVLAFSEFIQFDVVPVLKVEDALAPIADYLG